MDYNFLKFENTGGKYENRITVTSNRSIGFPAKFYQENNVQEYKYVVLYFDKDQMAIGIKFIKDDNEPHKFTIIKSKMGYGGSIMATSFFKKHDIDTKMHKGRYEWKKIDNNFGTLFVIELKKG